MHRFDVGKLPHDVLSKMISKLPIIHDDVVVAPKIGEDAAVIDLGDRYLVVASDPITFTAKDIGFYLVTINANDIAVMGAKPRYLIVTLLLPENLTDAQLVNEIFDSIASASRSLEVSVIGGHTEITYGIDRPIAIGTML
ncbi:MAG: hydrogenase expression/formation protein, partial [Candidatus Hydrothermota bacterium]